MLIGADDPRIRERGHDKLKTLGALSAATRQDVHHWIEQLIAQECLSRTGEFPTLTVTPKGWRVIRGEEKPRLPLPSGQRVSRSRIAVDSWEGVDQELFEKLRALRRQIADEEQVPAFVVLSDATLRDMARRRPSTWVNLLSVTGIGERKRADYGERFLASITAHCRTHSIPTDVTPPNRPRPPAPILGIHPVSRDDATNLAFELFDRGGTLDDVAVAIGRSRKRTSLYLTKYLAARGRSTPEPWLDDDTFARIRAAAQNGIEWLKPIFESLGGTVDYDLIRIGVACLRNQTEAGTEVKNPAAR